MGIHGLHTGALASEIGARIVRYAHLSSPVGAAATADGFNGGGVIRLPGAPHDSSGIIIRAAVQTNVASTADTTGINIHKKIAVGNEKTGAAAVSNGDGISILMGGADKTLETPIAIGSITELALAPPDDDSKWSRAIAALAGAPNTATQTDLDLIAVAQDDFYNGAEIVRADTGEVATVTDYTSANRRLTHTAWSGGGGGVAAAVVITIVQNNHIPALVGAPNTATQTDLDARAANINDYYNNASLFRTDTKESAVVTDYAAANRRCTHTAWSAGGGAVPAGTAIVVTHDNLVVHDGDRLFMTHGTGVNMMGECEWFVDVLERSKFNRNN